MNSMNTKEGRQLVYNREEHLPVIRAFVKQVEKEFDIPSGSIFSNYRGRMVVDLRKCIFSTIYDQLKISTTVLGQIFSKDHSSVVLSIKSLKDEMPFNKGLENCFRKVGTIAQLHFEIDFSYLNNIPQYGWNYKTIRFN